MIYPCQTLFPALIRNSPTMPNFQLRTLAPEDLAQIMTLQQAYQAIYADAVVIPAPVYLSGSFEEGKNVLCAFDEQGTLRGYAPLFPNLILEPNPLPHIIWAEVKTDPSLKSPMLLKDRLFAKLKQRAQELARFHPGHAAHLTFQYAPTETGSISYVLSKGCVYTESIFRMSCDLSRALPVLSPPSNIEVRIWHMDTPAEQQAYVQARNQAFPDAPTTLADWQFFTQSPLWQVGTSLTAFDGQNIVGSVAVFWDPAENERTGKRIGNTEYIFVLPKWRKRGIAAYLISQGLTYLQAHGLEQAQLEVRASNPSALNLYQRLGFRVSGETRLFVLKL